MPANLSSAESAGAVTFLHPILQLLGVEDEVFVVRKAAHFTEYLILNAIGYGTIRAWLRERTAILRAHATILVLVPCVDEFIQIFVPGRDGRVTDVLIDAAGGLLGIAVAYLVARLVSAREATSGARD